MSQGKFTLSYGGQTVVLSPLVGSIPSRKKRMEIGAVTLTGQEVVQGITARSPLLVRTLKLALVMRDYLLIENMIDAQDEALQAFSGSALVTVTDETFPLGSNAAGKPNRTIVSTFTRSGVTENYCSFSALIEWAEGQDLLHKRHGNLYDPWLATLIVKEV